MKIYDKLITEEDHVGHQLTKFFAEVGKKTAEGVPPSSKVQSWIQFLGPPCSKSMVPEPVTEKELAKIILNLKILLLVSTKFLLKSLSSFFH